MHLKLTRLELTIERSYQTHSHNIPQHNKISQKVLVKEKHVLEQDTLLHWLIQSSIEKKKCCPFLLLESPGLGPLPPSQGLQTTFSSSGTPDLSTCLGIDSLDVHPRGHKGLWCSLLASLVLRICPLMGRWSATLFHWWLNSLALLSTFYLLKDTFNNPTVDRQLTGCPAPSGDTLGHRDTDSIPKAFWEVSLPGAYAVKTLEGVFPLNKEKAGF